MNIGLFRFEVALSALLDNKASVADKEWAVQELRYLVDGLNSSYYVEYPLKQAIDILLKAVFSLTGVGQNDND